jgi:hypothetical protein
MRSIIVSLVENGRVTAFVTPMWEPYPDAAAFGVIGARCGHPPGAEG